MSAPRGPLAGLAERHEQLGQALTALRANVAYLLRKCAGQPALAGAARDVESQGAAIDRQLRALLHQLAPAAPDADPCPPLRPLLHRLLENWHDGGHHQLHVTPPDLCLPGALGQALCRMTLNALELAALRPVGGALRIAVMVDTADPSQVRWSVCDDAGLRLDARLPLGGEGR